MIRDIVGGPKVNPAEFRPPRRDLRRRPRQSRQAACWAARPTSSSPSRARWLFAPASPASGTGGLARARLWLRRRRSFCASWRDWGAARGLHRLAMSRTACWPRRVKRWPASLGPAPRAGRPRTGARARPFCRPPVRQSSPSAPCCTTCRSPSGRRSIASLGRVLKPGGRIYVFRSTIRAILWSATSIARTPIDDNAILLDEAEVRARPARFGALRHRLGLPDVHARRASHFCVGSIAFWRWLPLGGAICRGGRARAPEGEGPWTDRPSKPD